MVVFCCIFLLHNKYFFIKTFLNTIMIIIKKIYFKLQKNATKVAKMVVFVVFVANFKISKMKISKNLCFL